MTLGGNRSGLQAAEIQPNQTWKATDEFFEEGGAWEEYLDTWKATGGFTFRKFRLRDETQYSFESFMTDWEIQRDAALALAKYNDQVTNLYTERWGVIVDQMIVSRLNAEELLEYSTQICDYQDSSTECPTE
jgi:hypothetical protein